MFKEGTCPRCHEKLQVPEEREKIICMFCGEEISVDEALGKQKKREVRKISAGEYAEYEKIAKDHLEQMIRTCDNPLKDFRKDRYADAFEGYYDRSRGLFEAVELLCANAESAQECLQGLARHTVETAQAELGRFRFKGHKNQKQMDYNFLISVYLVPSALKYPGDYTEAFADGLIAVWNEAFRMNMGKARYEDIVGGFRRKLCYITTAVCESLGKGTDCYELRLLKQYRDEYLESSPEGRRMVEEYYDIAPTIVKRLEKEPERAEIFRGLYESYLMPCIRKIEDGQYEECKDRYETMVQELKERYITRIS
ncbi:MAG: CFI-box-CTERM domain-containing protein [Eubacteriales bacterium]|nr:CFI-box-CTERM domain-containing protein [Eubacteriales bacterium]